MHEGRIGGLNLRWLVALSGLGLALLHHTFREFYKRGKERVGLGVDATSLTGATRLYERAGMHVQKTFHNYELELRPGTELGTEVL